MPGPGDLQPASSIPPALARRELLQFLRRLVILGVLIAGLLVAGTIGFMLFEDRSAWFAFVWSLDTIATVGSIPAPETVGGQIVKVTLIVLGVGTLFYALVTATEFFVAGHVSGLLDQRRTQRMIDSLHGHAIIAGFGRVGRQVARDLRAAGVKYVVVDNGGNRALAQGVGVRFIEGSAADDDILRDAGIDRADSIIACADSDAENIFITLSARELRPDIRIIARASIEDSEKKLLRAGADRVISPYIESGHEMARFALQPNVSGVVAVAPEFRLEEISVPDGSDAVGRAIGDLRGSAVIAAIIHADGTFTAQPAAHVALRSGDIIVAMGNASAMDRLEGVFAPTGRQAASA